MEPPSSVGFSSEDMLPAVRLERTLCVLRKVQGVTSVHAYQRTARERLNVSIVKLRCRGQPVVAHCSNKCPELHDAAAAVLRKVTAIVGEEEIAAARQRAAADAQRADAAQLLAASAASSRPTNFFAVSQRKQKLDGELKAANERVLSADSVVKAAQHEVGMLAKAVQLAELQLDSAREKAAEAQQQKLKAKAEAAAISAQIEELCRKRQRVDEAPAGAAAEAPLPEEEDDENSYGEYTSAIWRRLEAAVQVRRKVVPQRGVEKPVHRKGARGPLHHWRRGLVGAVQDWAEGSMEMVVVLIMRLIQFFNVADDILELIKQHDAGVPICHLPAAAGVSYCAFRSAASH